MMDLSISNDFLFDRIWGQVDSLIYLLLAWIAGAFGGWLSRVTVIAHLKLRARIVIGLSTLGLGAMLASWFEVPAIWVLAALTGSSITLIWFALRGFSRLGIVNAFPTTEEGISAEKSLRLVKKELMFLGIGGHKLSSSKELRKAFDRCKQEGGSVRFLLSDPENQGLALLSSQNRRSEGAYKSRVSESIREILHQAREADVKCEIRLYEIDNEKALSRFRMMFIDGNLCIFSHLVWNDKEGLDNSQLILLKGKERAETSLYFAYLSLFEDLWAASSLKTVPSAGAKL